MSKFKVGEKIRVYIGVNTDDYDFLEEEFKPYVDDLVTEIRRDSLMKIGLYENWFHPKQCRRLIPKKKRRSVWVNPNCDLILAIEQNHHFAKYILSTEAKHDWIEFREVVKK